MQFDDVLSKLGHCGPYQRWVYCLLCLPIVFVGIQIMSPVFTLATPKHRCAIPGLENDTYQIKDEQHRQLVKQWVPGYDDVSDSAGKCYVYSKKVNSTNGNTTSLTPCSKWVYDRTVFKNTAITETDLVCSRTIYRAHATTALNVGSLVGYLFLGTISDRYGRKKTYLLEIALMAVTATFLIWLPSVYLFIVIRALIGLGFGVFYNTAFVYALEFIGPSRRTLLGMLVNYFWAAGLFLQALLAYGLREWRHLQLAVSLPFFGFLSYWWFVPESPRWLISRGQEKEAENVLLRMAKFNGVSLELDSLSELTVDSRAREETSHLTSFVLLFKYRDLCIRTMIVFLSWFVVSMMYYGLSLNVGNLVGDIYVNFTLSAIMELLAYSLSIPVIVRMGRKRFHCACMLVGGLALLVTIFPVVYGNKAVEWVVVVLAMVGKLAASAAYATIYLFTTELYPTVVRSSAMGYAALFAGIGGLVAPYIVELANLLNSSVSKVVPLVVFGISAFLAGLTALVLPDTSNVKLPETIQDARSFKR